MQDQKLCALAKYRCSEEHSELFEKIQVILQKTHPIAKKRHCLPYWAASSISLRQAQPVTRQIER